MADQNLDLWAKLKLAFIDPAYSSLYGAISRHYEKYGTIPSFDDLLVTVRDTATYNIFEAVRLLEVPDVDPNVAIDALIDHYTQDETVKLLDKFVDKLPIYDTAEIKDNLANIVLTLDEKTLTAEGVFGMDNIMIFRNQDELARERVHLGINNTFDAVLAGVARQELILIGGERGSGKSIISNNIFCNQYENGNCSAYFSIEMTGQETFERTMAILAGVDYQQLKQGKLDDQDVLKVVKVRANMFEDADELVHQFTIDRDRFKFEEALVREKRLKETNQITIIDDRALTLSSIDLHLGKLKARYGDKLTVAVVDYLNQIVIEGAGQYDWQPQIVVSKKLKDLARKYDIIMVSPYQIDATGQARFAKGILDAADIALIMHAHDKELGAISFETTKIRGGRDMKFTSPINWNTLRVSPTPMDTPIKKEKETVKKAKKTGEEAVDMPWNE